MPLEVSARIGALIVGAAAARGASVDALRAATGFDPSVAADPDAFMPMAMADALWEAAAAATGDDAFGLHAAEHLRPGQMDVLDYAVRTAPTLRTAFERLVRYDRLVRDAGALSVTDDGGARTVIAYDDRPGGKPSRHATECKLAALLVLAQQITGRPLCPLAVELRHRAPADTAEHVRVFGVMPRFGGTSDALTVERAALDAACPAADPALWRILERHVDTMLARRPAAVRTADRVRDQLARVLADGSATLADTAARLHMSERSLQRRLADEDTTFEAILDELRRELALTYLRDRRIAIAEVAYLLGYSEPSAFHRAFKRWTGSTPDRTRSQPAG